MPTYQYRCRDCGEDLEAVQAFTDDALTECPACDGSLRKLFSAVGISFKGSGFYKTDSRGSSKADRGDKADTGEKGDKSDKGEKSGDKGDKVTTSAKDGASSSSGEKATTPAKESSPSKPAKDTKATPAPAKSA